MGCRRLPTAALLTALALCLATGLGASQPQQPASPTQAAISLKVLVEAAEHAALVEDWDAASDRTDEAEALVATWPLEQLKRPDLAPLLERLKVVEKSLEEDDEVPSGEGPDGLRMPAEVVALVGEDLRKEREQVRAAEQDTVFDFPIDLNDKVLTWVHIFSTERKGFVEGALSRGSRYLPMVRQIFAEEGVPQDLAYLAVIESGFKNTANSRAKAVGMWQFIRSTGRIYGLTGNAWVEERRDPAKSARASARYLKNLYDSSGDWYLALLGYNAGPLTTERAIQNLGTRNFWDLARSRWLRNETKNYVPELLAAILVGRNPERYGLQMYPLPPFAFETVEVDKMTSLSVLASYAGTQTEVLKDLNPELLRNSTPPGRYTLRVPPGSSGAAARALAHIPAGKRLDFDSYLIKRGDTLRSVAIRFNVSPEDLLSANNISRAKFKPGRRIQVPPPATSPVDKQDLIPMTDQTRARRERPVEPLPTIPGEELPEPAAEPAPWPTPPLDPVTRPEAVPATAQVTPSEKGVLPKFHEVKGGETLFSIGIRYGLDPADLRRWNKLKRNRIMIGQRLRLQRP